MRPLLQYYEALEAQALWEGGITMTALVALIQCSTDEALRQANDIAESPLVVDLAPTTSWRLGGVILTHHMLYVIAFDEDDGDDIDQDGGVASHSDASPFERVSDASAPDSAPSSSPVLEGDGSPQSKFEAVLSRLPPFHVVVEDVVEAIRSVELVEQPLLAGSASPGAVRPGPVVIRVSTLSQDVRFVLKASLSFDNIELGEMVHAFGVLPGVDVCQRVPLMRSASRDRMEAVDGPHCSPSPEARSAFRSTTTAGSRSSRGHASQQQHLEFASPRWEQADDPSAATAAVLDQVQIVVDESSERNALYLEESDARCRCCLERCVLVAEDIEAHCKEVIAAAQRQPVEVTPKSALIEGTALLDLLDAEERAARLRLGVFLTQRKKKAAEEGLEAERATLVREGSAFKDRIHNELEVLQRALREKEAALYEVTCTLKETVRERDDLRDREQHVVENARRREADLHAQLKELRSQQTAA